TRLLSWRSASPTGVICSRRPSRTNSRSWNSSSRRRIWRLMADWETLRRAPPAVDEPASAIARMISRCRRAIQDSEPLPPRSEMKRIYRKHRNCLWLPGAVAAQRPDPVAEFLEIRDRALKARQRPRGLDVHVEGVLPRLAAERTRLDLGEVDVAQRESRQRLEERARPAREREHHRCLVGAVDAGGRRRHDAEPRNV